MVSTGIDLYAHFDTPCGLTVSALGTERALQTRGAKVRRHTVSSSAGEIRVDAREGGDINLLHVNPVDVFGLLMWRHVPMNLEGRLNVCAPFWELDRVPDFWLPVLECMDAVLAPTRFVGDAIRAAIPEMRVIPLPQAVEIPDGVEPDRARFRLPRDVFLFGTSFAAEAVLERKNPWATIDAFRRAFPDDEGVHLVVRASPAAEVDPVDTWNSLEEYAGHDPRVHVLRGRLDYAGVLSLYATLDAYVSLHRAEGLGLGMMESMSLGTAVIATAWSGNMDFMTHENSMPVSWAMTPVQVPDSNPYSERSIGFVGQWADPNIEDAAEKMKQIYENSDLRHALVDRARSDMANRRAAVARAEFFDELTAMLPVKALAGKASRSEMFKALETREQRRGVYMRPYLRARRLAGRVLRASRLR